MDDQSAAGERNVVRAKLSRGSTSLADLRALFPRALIFAMYGLTECKRVSYLEPERVRLDPSDAVDTLLAMTVAHIVYQGETVRYILKSEAGLELQAVELGEVRFATGGATLPYNDDWTCGIRLGDGDWPDFTAERLFAAKAKARAAERYGT